MVRKGLIAHNGARFVSAMKRGLSMRAAAADSAAVSRTFFLGLRLLLLVSAIARIFLVLAGGRFFISDEGRYLHGVHLYHHLLHREWSGAAEILRHSDNWGFIIVGALTTAVQHVAAFAVGDLPWSAGYTALQGNLNGGAFLLAMAPVAGIWGVFHLALRLGAGQCEAFCGALLFALSNTAFYFSRHLFPYDTSLALTLAAIFIAVGPSGKIRSVIAGIIGGAAFHVYNGYWYLLPLVVLSRLFNRDRDRTAVLETSLTAGGALLAMAMPYGWGCLVFGSSFLQSTMVYGRSVVQGLYREGWSFPWEYFWHSEGIFGLLVIGLPLVFWLHEKERAPLRIRYIAAAVLGMYLVWIGVSVGAHLFVLNARLVKPLIPFACLLGGWGLAGLFAYQRKLGWAAVALLAGSAFTNLSPHYWRVFPREFEAEAVNRVGNPKHTVSVSGSYFRPQIPPVDAPAYALINAQYLYPVRAAATNPAGETIISAAHPLEYLPYQYDGFTPRQRRILRETDIRMRLVRLADPNAVPDLPPLAFRAQNLDWPDGFDSEAKVANANPAAVAQP